MESMSWLAEHVETIRIGRKEECCMCGRLKDRGAGERCAKFVGQYNGEEPYVDAWT